jgi:hypothetical protein
MIRNTLFVLMLIMSTNLFSQVGQGITKPENHKFGVYYLDDQSIMFNTDGIIFSGGEIPQLTEIFKTADKLSVICDAILMLTDSLYMEVSNYDLFSFKLTEKGYSFVLNSELTREGDKKIGYQII